MFLLFRYIKVYLQMFVDTMEPRTEKKTSNLEEKNTILIMWAQISGKIA